MRKQSSQAKRRAYEAKRREQRREIAVQARISAAVTAARTESYEAGKAEGARGVKSLVLEHAGRLYQERKDTDAAAVREVHRQL